MGLRVCVVGRSDGQAAYPRLPEANVDVLAHVPRIELFSPDLARGYDAILVGVAGADAASPAWQEAIRRATRVRPVLAVAETADVRAVALVATSTGVRGAVDRSISPDAMRRSLEAVARGETAFPHAVVSSLLRAEAGPSPGGTRRWLTPRQHEVVDLIAEGATDREIAHALHISESTAHKHVQNALRRMGARTRSHLVARMRSISPT